MLRSYSVIVPVLNQEREIVRTLQSIRASMDYFEANHSDAGSIRSEVIVVDDGSTDATAERVRDCARADPRLRLLQHRQSFGAGAARNSGVRASQGEVLFYCDGDDLYFPEHLFVGFCILDLSASLAGAPSERMRLHVAGRAHVVVAGGNPLAAVRTGVYIDEAVHPYWTLAIQNTLTQNLCLRRECHLWMEGFPEEQVYKTICGCEDGAYNQSLEIFFRVASIDLQTVQYFRRPGNSFDRQSERLRHPPGSAFDQAAPDPLHKIRLRREDEHIGYLLDKWRVLGAPSLPPGVLNWETVADELLRRKRTAEAIRILEEADRQGMVLSTELANKIRRAHEQADCE